MHESVFDERRRPKFLAKNLSNKVEIDAGNNDTIILVFFFLSFLLWLGKTRSALESKFQSKVLSYSLIVYMRSVLKRN